MARLRKRKIALYLLYAAFTAGIIWQAIALISLLRTPRGYYPEKYLTVRVDGNVMRPGRYRVSEGTTQFEILKVAGVRSTSDLSSANLSLETQNNQNISVGTLNKPVSINPAAASLRLEFFLGELNIISKDGRSRPQQEGLTMDEGDRVQTEAKSQVEFSIGTYSRLDIDNFSEVIFDKINGVEEDKTVTDVFQKSGACWYKIVYASKQERFKVTLPTVKLTVAGSGADFLLDMQPDMIRVHNIDGLILIERPDGSEAVNLITGQTAAIYSDGRPFQITRISSDVNANEQFSQLVKEKTNYMMRYMPLTFLFCGTPNIFYLVSVQFDNGLIQVVKFPAETSVEQFAQGFSTLDQAYLYGGSVFVSTLLEQIMNTRITNFCVFSREDIMHIAASVGGINVPLDNKAASYLKLLPGPQKLSNLLLVRFMSPTVSGAEDSQRRQVEVLKALFNGLRSKNIVLTALLADQILANVETNFSSSEVMNHYTKFTSRANWTFKTLELPVKSVKGRDRMLLEPELDKTRKMLSPES